MLLARRFAPLFLSLSRLSWLMVASLGAISFSLSFNGRVNGSINLPIVVLKALEAPGAPAIAMKETSATATSQSAPSSTLDTPAQKIGGRMLTALEQLWNSWLQLPRSRIEHLNTVIKNHAMFNGAPFRGWVQNLAVFVKITLHVTAERTSARGGGFSANRDTRALVGGSTGSARLYRFKCGCSQRVCASWVCKILTL